MDETTTQRIKDSIAAERTRESVPDDFEDLPPIPAKRYIDPAFFELEKTHVFGKSWLIAGHTDQLPEKGSYFLWKDSGRSIVVVRDGEGGIRAYYNTCKHRGGPIAQEACGKVSRFRCPYHSWTYELSGELVAIPDKRDFKSLDYAKLGLSAVRCETWGSWIFVNEDAEAPPLLESLGPIPDELSDWPLDELKFVHKYSMDIDCNWKAAVDAFLEVYHLKHIHPHTSHAFLDYTGSAMGLLEGGHSRMPSPIRPEHLVDGNVPNELPDLPSVGEIARITNLAYQVFPNVVMPLDPTGFCLLIFWPKDIRSTRMDVVWFGKAWEGETRPDGWDGRIKIFDMVLREDTENLAWIQKSLETPAFSEIPLSYQERRIYHFHEQIDRMIGVDRVPEEMRVVPRLGPLVE